MKYPQLVSPRAVNAISDWLVSRLEQLGVESPQIYTRLLLSLLQSSVQVNDPIEFSNLEAFFTSRKGGHSKRFHLPSDTETLKKLNAVQCLREIVASDQETTAIEQLVDELCEKLNEIEKKTHELSNERFLTQGRLNSSEHGSTPAADLCGGRICNQRALCPPQQHLTKGLDIAAISDAKRPLSRANDVRDSDNDPKKRYFRAFPALTKDMEESFRVWRRNAKSLTWPIVGRSINADNTLVGKSNSVRPTYSAIEGEERRNKLKVSSLTEQYMPTDTEIEPVASDTHHALGVAASTSAKKKAKRRRNSALPKGKPNQTIRKVAAGTTGTCSTGSAPTKPYNAHQNPHHRYATPAWDTDFKGCWEMGPDLIKEFLSHQKGATADGYDNSVLMESSVRNECDRSRGVVAAEGPSFVDKSAMEGASSFDIALCFGQDEHHPFDIEEGEGVDYVDEDYDDNTLTSMAEFSQLENPRRLYQREGILQRPVCNAVLAADCLDAEEQQNFASFKAKFDSSVEALWKDADQQSDSMSGINNASTGTFSSAVYAAASLNAMAPFRQDLCNFWSNYDQSQYNPPVKFAPAASMSSMITTRLDDSSASSAAGAEMNNSSDYFSMPSNLDNFDKSVGALRRATETGGESLGGHTPSINVFLQNSIWSSSGDCVHTIGAGSTDDFLYKVWNSNKKLSQFDVAHPKEDKVVGRNDNALGFRRANDAMTLSGASSETGGGAAAAFDFSYNRLKWSEGINAGPSYQNMLQPSLSAADVSAEGSMAVDKSRPVGSAATVTGANWDAPVYGENAQPDLKSWCASNPMSLTGLYGNDVCDSITREIEEENGPIVTLPNHSAATSGFVSYARIKQSGLLQCMPKPLQPSSASASRMPKDYFNNGEEENLLNSEKTHFHPIEDFEDGHSFDISNDLDEVEYARNANGYLCHESNEYLEYTRNDAYLADEEVAANNTAVSGGEAASTQGRNGRGAGPRSRLKRPGKKAFTIRFLVNRAKEIACQTEDIYFDMSSGSAEEPMLSSEHAIKAATSYNRADDCARQSNSDGIMNAVSKAVVAAAQAAAEQRMSADHAPLSWVPASSQSSARTWAEDLSDQGDEVDYCKVNQFWSMQEVERQCHQRRKPSSSFQNRGRADVDRCDENSLDNTSHTLWGMCAVCNSCDYGKSMPANRLLRDELKLEADEIMSDLRYMQDLYIGESAECTAENTEFEQSCGNSKNSEGGEDNTLVGNVSDTSMVVDNVQASMLQKVNQLIEDLLRPEQTGKLIMRADENMASPGAEHKTAIRSALSTKISDGLNEERRAVNSWHYDNEDFRSIWRHDPLAMEMSKGEYKADEAKYAAMQPMELLKQVGGPLDENQLYSDKLNWEHDNLAKIWQQGEQVPSVAPADDMLSKMDVSNIENEDKQHEGVAAMPDGGESCRDIVEKKNLKNLQNHANASPLSKPATSATYKRVQQFLNSSAAKLKVAANRKRRHSASQNFYHQHHSLQHCSANNNNDKITDLNQYQQAFINIGSASEELALPHEPKQTIITCKYWTTATNGTQASLDSATAAMMLLAAATNGRPDNMIAKTGYDAGNEEATMIEENAFGNTITCLIDKNESILKHVAALARPLTR